MIFTDGILEFFLSVGNSIMEWLGGRSKVIGCIMALLMENKRGYMALLLVFSQALPTFFLAKPRPNRDLNRSNSDLPVCFLL